MSNKQKRRESKRRNRYRDAGRKAALDYGAWKQTQERLQARRPYPSPFINYVQ